MKTLSLGVSLICLMTTFVSFEAGATFHRIPFPQAPGEAIKTQTYEEDNAGASGSSMKVSSMKVSSGFTVRLVRAKSRSSFKTVFKVEALDYTIQVSSFKTEEEAKANIADLQQNKLADLWIMNAKISGQNWYRVCSGHYKSKGDAASAQAVVAEKSGSKQAFVQKVVPRLTASNSNAS